MSILNPKAVVVIPTLNAGAPLAACLAALGRQRFREFETIVVDNGGQASAADARVIRPGGNIGFGAAINLGARESKAAFVASLNDDAEPEPQWLGELVRAMEADAQVGMCASAVLLDARRMDSAGLLLCGDGSTKQRGHGEAPERFANEEDALMPSGSAALYRRELFDELGGFDESFFLYCEDSDLGLRARWQGWRCRYVASARVRHGYSVSAGRASALKAYLVERNRLRVAMKCLPLGMLWKGPLVAMARYWWHWRLPHGAASEFRKDGGAGAVMLAWFVVKAHLAMIFQLPVLVVKRWRIRATAKISAAEFTRLAEQYRISPLEVAGQ